MHHSLSLEPLPLPPSLQQSQVISSASELSYHVIEAGAKGDPLLILLHGFPELAFSWRKVMPLLAEAGYYVVAFDQRGYGRTTGWDNSDFENVDLRTFVQTNLVRDVIVLAKRIGYHQVECVVGHDFGCVPASLCALIRPDMFRKVVLLGFKKLRRSGTAPMQLSCALCLEADGDLLADPFTGSPRLPFNIAPDEGQTSKTDVNQQLMQLDPPRKHYRWYLSSEAANKEMAPSEGLHDFLRGYFHLKSGDADNRPYPLNGMTASELGKLPRYYAMPLQLGMRQTIDQDMTNQERANMREKSSRWLPDADLRVFVNEFERTGFQGGLNWYRITTEPELLRDLDIFADKKIEIPLLCISGTKDWLIYQVPGSIKAMEEACTDFHGLKWIEGAGHWPQQEQPREIVIALLNFLENRE